MTTVFLSHASQDGRLAEELADWLRRNGFTDLFIDHTEIRVGDRWADALRNANASCRIVLCLVTPPWLESDECYAEFLAGWYAGKRIIPLLAICGAPLNERQQHRMSRILGEDQGFDLAAVGAPHQLTFDAQPNLSATLIAGLKAGGALTRIGLDPMAFEVDHTRRPDPFPGLESFGDDDADAAIFFGRSPEIATCIEDLREMRAAGDRRAYIILGASGSGKSSLMKAGVLPRLRRERGWLVLRSFRPGADPLYSFAEAIARTAANWRIHWAPGSIHEELLTAWRTATQIQSREVSRATGNSSDLPPQSSATFNTDLIEAVERRMRPIRDQADKSAATCLVAIDQAEELAQSQEESGVALGDFIAALSVMAADEGTPIPYLFVLTVRDDRFSELRSSDRFARILTRTADIRSLPLYRFAHAIEQPAERYGVVMEPALVQAMIEDAPETDALPLLAFALRRLWTRFALERRIRRGNYELFGKLPGLIEDAAERALRGMDPRDDSPLTPARVSTEREQRAARVFVPALAQVNERGDAIRRLTPADAFSEGDKELLVPFNRWRLVSVRGNVIEVSHEAMFREWPRFAEWLKPEKARLDALREVEAAAATWDSQNRKQEYLTHRGRRLTAAESLWNFPDYRRQIETIDSLRAYLIACRRVERGRLLSVFVIGLSLSVAAFTLVATNMRVIGTFVDIAENVQAALPGASFATNQIRDEYAVRRDFLRDVLQQYMTLAFKDLTLPTAESATSNMKSGGLRPFGDSTLANRKTISRDGTSDRRRAAAEVLMQARTDGAPSDSWTIGQITAGLGEGVLQTGQLQTYFDSNFIPECACWAPIDGDQHLGATAWIILGQATQGVRIRTDILNGILGRQSHDGGWPLFFNADHVRASNSTYATALLLLALHHVSSTGNFDTALSTPIGNAMSQARSWLHARAPKDGQYWIDYPDGFGRMVPSRGLSALVLYVLMETGDMSDDQKLFHEWFDKLDSPTSLDQVDTSDQFVKLVDGKVRRDGTRYLNFCWELAAIGRGARHLKPFERIRARRFFLDALEKWPRDESGRFDFVTAETLFAVNTLFNEGGEWSSVR